MANSSSFYLKENGIIKNSACFSTFNHGYKKDDYIIVEYDKIIDKDKFLLYLEYISDFCRIEKVVDDENSKEVRIFPASTQLLDLKLLGMTVRFSWEGRYGVIDDVFYPIYETFMDLVPMFPDVDKAILLIFSHNINLYGKIYNWNHCFSYIGYNNVKNYPTLIDSKTILTSRERNISNGLFKDSPDLKIESKQSNWKREDYERVLTAMLDIKKL